MIYYILNKSIRFYWIWNISIIICFFLLFTVPSIAQEKVEYDDLLAMSFDELMNVKVITASKFSEDIKDVPASVIVLNRDEIQQLGYSTIQEIIENIPGIYMIDDYY